MTATLPRRPATAPAPQPQPRGHRRVVVSNRELVTLLAVLAVLGTAALPLARVYVGLAFLRPVLAAVVLSVGLSWGARRLGAGPVSALVVSVVGWVMFCGTAFLSTTLVAG